MVANFVLADEINRAPAKVQSALLEVMAERHLSIGGKTFPMPDPFLVLATQNPIENEGVYPLPEAQRDRFLFKIVVEYPNVEEEREIVYRMGATPPEAQQVIDPDELVRLQGVASRVFVHHALVDYVVRLVVATRTPAEHGLSDVAGWVSYGASPRATLGIVGVRRGRSRSSAAATTSSRRTCSTSPPTCCGTGWCSPTTPSPTACRWTTSSPGSSVRCRCRRSARGPRAVLSTAGLPWPESSADHRRAGHERGRASRHGPGPARRGPRSTRVRNGHSMRADRRTALLAATGSLLLPRAGSAQTGVPDRDVLEALLARERELESAYAAAARRRVIDAGLARHLGRQEREHAEGLERTLAGRPRNPVASVAPPELNRALAGGRRPFLRYATALEEAAVAAYADAVTALRDEKLLQPLGSIMASQGQHLVLLRRELGISPLTRAYETG